MSAIPLTRSTHRRPFAAPISTEKVSIAFRGFFAAMDAWSVSNEEAQVLLGRPKRSTFYLWKRGDIRNVPYDTVCRISYVLGIWKALQILFQDPDQADRWLRRDNRLLGGQSALKRMLGGDVTDLANIRELLDGARGGGV